MNVLIVEDDESIANLVKINLTAEGYHCTCAYDGKAGADYLEKEVFDLILLDIMLPEIDGYELLEYIKPFGTPVIFMTAKGAVNDRIRGLKLGADDYIVKPFQIGELLARVEALLRRYGKLCLWECHWAGEKICFSGIPAEQVYLTVNPVSGAGTV